MQLVFKVNNHERELDVEPRELLSDVLRGALGLTGTHVGCDTSQCGACVIHVDGRSVKACTMLAIQANGRDVTTIEGLAREGRLHPLQQAFHETHALQCGFCTSGMVMSVVDFLRNNPTPDEHAIREALEVNLCRCTGYQNIVSAVQLAAQSLSGGAATS